jgi:hypothetical protein
MEELTMPSDDIPDDVRKEHNDWVRGLMEDIEWEPLRIFVSRLMFDEPDDAGANDGEGGNDDVE